MEENKNLKNLIDNYGCNLGSYKFILPGSEIFRYVGQSVMRVHYFKEDEVWKNDYTPAMILSINNFDPMTMTYNCSYIIEGEKDVKEMRIIPEGYSWGDPDIEDVMYRFVPFSIHTAMIEEQCFFERLSKIYASRKSLSKGEIETIARSKERDAILKYSHNIGAVVKLSSGEYLWIRIHKLTLTHRKGTQYNLKFEDNEHMWSFLVEFSNEEFDFNGLGTFKLIDLADPDDETFAKATVSEKEKASPENVVADEGTVAVDEVATA